MSVDPREVGRRLQEWRRAKRETQQTIAERLETSRSNVAAIEAGQRRVSAQQIADLARAYRLSVSSLVRPGPEPARLSAQFRLPVDARPEDREALDAAVAQLEQLVERYLRLEVLVSAALRPLAPAPPYEVSLTKNARADGEQVAEAERRRLGLGDGPVDELRDLLERELGIRAFSLELPGGIAGLFGVSATAGPAVAINTAHPAPRQRWTLSHEYAHFLLHRDRAEITKLSGYQRVPEFERFAEAFAGAFLMPRSGLERRLRHLVAGDRDIVIADLLVLAGEFGVSPQALFLRLEDLGLIPAGEWDRVQATRVDLLRHEKIQPERRRQRDTSRFPRRYVLLALDAYERGLLTERELADYLEIDRLELRRFLADTAHTSVEGAGEIRNVQLQLGGIVDVNSR
jgi:Zn-dependent peptidase ImmA (M78 family)/transcriptional regulator with XRE-family HTH domain